MQLNNFFGVDIVLEDIDTVLHIVCVPCLDERVPKRLSR